MERQKSNIPLAGQGSVAENQGGETATVLYGKLDALNGQVNEVMNDPAVRRMALKVGITILAKRYPALSVLLGAFGDTAVKQTSGRSANRRPMPAKKMGRGL